LRSGAVACIGAACIATSGITRADDAHLERNLAAACAACHGTDGLSAGGIASLAGMPRDALIRTMREVRTGKRPSTVMQQLAKGYTDRDVALIAAYFAAQSPRRP
jgi:cytochrome c553